jgi:hypothetical protein
MHEGDGTLRLRVSAYNGGLNSYRLKSFLDKPIEIGGDDYPNVPVRDKFGDGSMHSSRFL